MGWSWYCGTGGAISVVSKNTERENIYHAEFLFQDCGVLLHCMRPVTKLWKDSACRVKRRLHFTFALCSSVATELHREPKPSFMWDIWLASLLGAGAAGFLYGAWHCNSSAHDLKVSGARFRREVELSFCFERERTEKRAEN